MTKAKTFARARAFLERVPMVDGHNDLPYVIRKHHSAQGDGRIRKQIRMFHA
jgi:membrane dipeptidase